MFHFSSSPADGVSPRLILDRVRAWALEEGFAEAGLVALPHVGEARDAARFEEWVRAGRAGTMRYLKKTGEDGRMLRTRVGNAFPWARSAVVCFAGYESAQPRSTEPAGKGAGWIARYAWTGRVDVQAAEKTSSGAKAHDGSMASMYGLKPVPFTGTSSSAPLAGKEDANGVRRASDYHKVLKKRLRALEERIREARMREGLGGFEARGYVDTGPVMERALATAAGVGWTGKNTCLIHPRLGSYGFLAVLLTSLDAQAEDAPLAVPDRCGSCRRCLEACPTGALTAPYQMDAARCISYLTIEHRGAIEPGLMEGMGRQVFGCDICQDVCPWNSPRRTPVSADPELEARAELVNPALEWLAEMDEAEFERWFNGSPVRRAGFEGLRRNVAIAMGNSGMERFAARLEEWAGAADEGLRTAARWALEKLRGSR
ncbi:MAG: tRNA epoxyqueuosine(34) reductase QueG [Terracidiphilus sp.]